MLHVYVYCHFSMNLCIYIMYLSVYILYIYMLPQEFCVHMYFNCMQFEKFMWHSSVRCWVCYSMFRRENVRVLWRSVARHGWSGMLHKKLHFFFNVSMQTVTVFEHQMSFRIFDTQFGVQGMKNIGEIWYCLVPFLT
jgi:hypothetical protein